MALITFLKHANFMDEAKLIENELHNIHRTRNRIGYLPNFLSLVISVYFQREKLLDGNLWILAFSLVVLGTIIRILIGEVYFKEWSQKVKWARMLNIAGFFILATGWGLHFMDVHQHYGAGAPNVSYTLLIIVAFITGSSTSLSGDKGSYLTFVVTLSGLVALTYLLDPHFTNAFIILNVILYLFFSISNYKLSHKQLIDVLASQIRASKEKEKLLNIINTVPGFVGLIDKDLTFYMANQATITMYPGIVGKRLGHLDPNSGWEKFVEDFMASDKNADIHEGHTIYQGEDVYALLNIQRMTDGGAIIVSIITTELVEAQKKLRDQEAKAQYSAKLASLGEMAAGIAHEVNNPLTIIQGSANIVRRLVDQTPLDIENIKNLTTKMITTSDRISKTVKSLKALSRNGANDPKEIFSLQTVIDQCLDISGQRFRQNGIELRMKNSPDDIQILGREVQISQVLINLINNSVDAIKSLNERWISITVNKRNSFIEIDISDSGSGIPVEIRKKIMDPFFTTKDVNQGTGLGLSISKNIIQDHGGELLLLPEEKNTTFRIRLPLSK